MQRPTCATTVLFVAIGTAYVPNALALLSSRTQVFNGTEGRMPVWVWWDWKGKIPVDFQMNLKTWQKHLPAKSFDLHLLNRTNIREFLPDIPDEYFRLYTAAQADFLRAALLTRHGGVYLDGDIMLMQDLTDALQPLFDDATDLLPYEGPGDKCPNTFTTNFMAGKQGNVVTSKWINTIMPKLKNKCKLPERNNSVEPVDVCCYNADGSARKECHVAWGCISKPPSVSTFKKGVRVSCVPEKLGMEATDTNEILFNEFSHEPRTQGDKVCWRAVTDSLLCANHRVVRNETRAYVHHYTGLFKRYGHHLYNMINRNKSSKWKTEADLMNSGTVVAELFRLALMS